MAKSFASYAEEYGSPLVALAADRRCKWWFSPGERGRGASGAVVLYGALRYGTDDDNANGRVDPTCRRRGTSKIHPVRAASNMANLYAPTPKLWSCLGSHGGVE